MASTREAARLTEAHRRAQLQLGARTVEQMRSAWRLLDFEDLDGSMPDWFRVTVPIIRSQHAASSTLAANYYVTFRRLEVPDAPPFTPVLAESLDDRALRASLQVTGPSTVKRATMRGRTADAAMSLGQARSASAAMRQALTGGRGTTMRSMQADRTAIGFARATSGKACAFCAMLASRGPVYKSARSATIGPVQVGNDFKAHDGCSCVAEPVYSTSADWPAGSRDYAELWSEATTGETDQLNAFRRALAAAES